MADKDQAQQQMERMTLEEANIVLQGLPGIKKLPMEVWDRIFELCEPVTAFMPISETYLPICKMMYPAAIRRLYRDVSVEQFPLKELAQLASANDSSFLQTRKAHLNVFNCFSKEEKAMSVYMVAQVISKMPNLTRLSLTLPQSLVLPKHVVTELLKNVEKLTKIRTVNVHWPTGDLALQICYALRDRSLKELEFMMAQGRFSESGPLAMPEVKKLYLTNHIDEFFLNGLSKSPQINIDKIHLRAHLTIDMQLSLARLTENVRVFSYTHYAMTSRDFDLNLPSPFGKNISELEIQCGEAIFNLPYRFLPPKLVRFKVWNADLCPFTIRDKLQNPLWLPRLRHFDIEFQRDNEYFTLGNYNGKETWCVSEYPAIIAPDGLTRFAPAMMDATADQLEAEIRKVANARSVELKWKGPS